MDKEQIILEIEDWKPSTDNIQSSIVNIQSSDSQKLNSYDHGRADNSVNPTRLQVHPLGNYPLRKTELCVSRYSVNGKECPWKSDWHTDAPGN